jgi:hypothetical protein
MPAVFGRQRRRFALLTATLLAAATCIVLVTPAARAETVTVNPDEARIIKMPDSVATIVIGNPLVADASLQAGGILVVTGKSYGSTNLLALDRTGRVVMDKSVEVRASSGTNLVVVYRGAERESYACAPQCESRLTLGDSANYFSQILTQSGLRTDQGQKQPPH